MPSTFTLTIELGNAAMDDAEDVAQALEEIAERLYRDGYAGDVEGRVRDFNGNTVGRWELS